MEIDRSKLSPAPFRVSDAHGLCVADADGNLVADYEPCGKREDAKLHTLAINAEDVLMRRTTWKLQCHPEKTLAKRWFVNFFSPGFDTILSREKTGYVHCHYHPFVALVEADKWFKANVESS